MRDGGVEACWVHNPKVPGSNPGLAFFLNKIEILFIFR